MIERVPLTPDEATELTKLQREHDQLARQTAIAGGSAGLETAEFIDAKNALLRNTRKIERLLNKQSDFKNAEEDDT